MAVVDLNLSALNLETFPDAYGKLTDALNERISILAAMGINLPSGGAGQAFYGVTEADNAKRMGPMNPKEVPSASKMNSLIRAIRNLATYFINPEDVTFSESYTDFPHNFLNELKRQSDEHSIGYCVGRTQSFDEETMDNWKQMFVEAAYWLNKMTMIQLPSNIDHREVSEIADNPYTAYTMDVPINTQPITSSWEKDFDAKIKINYERKQDQTQSDPTIKRKWECNTGLIVTNRAPWDAVCKLYFVLPPYDASDTKWDGVFPAGRRVLQRKWNQPQKWQYLTRQLQVESGAYQHDPQDHPDEYWYTDELVIEETEVLLSSVWTAKKSYREHTVYSGGSDNSRVSKTEDSFEKNFSPDGDQEVLLTQESISYGPDPNEYGRGTPTNNLTANVYAWSGFGLLSAISMPLEETVEAHSKKKLACLSFNQIPEELPDFDAYVGNDWDRGNHNWSESIYVNYDIRIVPFMDYADSITMFNVVDGTESSGNASEGSTP
jgi:hypothetical protein